MADTIPDSQSSEREHSPSKGEQGEPVVVIDKLVKQLPSVLRPFSYIMPLTYANDALRGVMLKGADFAGIAGQLSALLAFALVMVLLSSLTMRRQIA